MCGIYGIIARDDKGLFTSDVDMLKRMMLETIKRGEDSSGLFITDYKDPFAMPTGVKVVGGPHNIYGDKETWEAVSDTVAITGGAVIGHGRWATKGSVTAANAHPFQHGHITMVHNGTINSGLDYKKRGEVDIEVDSHALCVAMAEKGVEEALTDINGAFAVIVHDALEGCLWIARNSDRPLHIYSTPSRHYIMSEYGALSWLMKDENKFTQSEPVRLFTSDLLIRVDLNDSKDYKTHVDLGEVKRKKWQALYAREEEERKKTGFPPTTILGTTGRTRTSVDAGGNASWPPGKEKVRFKVIQVDSTNTGHFKYIGYTNDGKEVHFLCNENKPEYISRWGTAEVNKIVYTKGKGESKFVKHRHIEWDPEREVSHSGHTFRDDGRPFHTMLNGVRIAVDDWNRRIGNEGCDVCDATFTALSYRDTILMDDNKFICRKCANTFLSHLVKDATEQTRSIH